MSNALVTIEEATKAYGSNTVLDKLSLTVTSGEFITLIGPSGCGKTTLLRLLAGLTPLSSGRILIGDQSPGGHDSTLACIFQDATLLPWRTALANVELPMQLKGIPTPERRQRARDLLQLVGLDKASARYPRQLSGGMKMRVSLARGLSLDPQILLLDEPFGALDAMTRNHLNEELLRLRERKPFTAFFVTHSVTEAVFLSTRILVMDSSPGRIAADLPISFAYPRNAHLREYPAYHAACTQVSQALHQCRNGGAA